MEREHKDLKYPFATYIRTSTNEKLKKLVKETGRKVTEITETALLEHIVKCAQSIPELTDSQTKTRGESYEGDCLS